MQERQAFQPTVDLLISEQLARCAINAALICLLAVVGDFTIPRPYIVSFIAYRLYRAFYDNLKWSRNNKAQVGDHIRNERRIPELIPVLGSQPAGDRGYNPAVGFRYFPPGPRLPPQPPSIITARWSLPNYTAW